MTAFFLAQPRWRTSLTLVLLAAGGLAAATFTSRVSQAGPAAPAPVAISAARVVEQPVAELDEFSGRIESVERVEIRPRVPGAIVAVHFQDGQLVKPNALLFTIDPAPYRAELARAEGAQAAAAAHLKMARAELARAQRLIGERAIAQRELEQRENAALEAEANEQSARAVVQGAALNLQYTAIRAPVGGRVSRAERSVGNLVDAGAGAAALTEIVSVSPVYVQFEIDEQSLIRYAAKGVAGNTGLSRLPVAIGLASEAGFPHPGRIHSFDNRLDTASGTMRVRALFDNPDGLLIPGMYARVRTSDAAEHAALLIDDKAVGNDQDQSFVMVVGKDNKVSYRAVQLGPLAKGLRVVRAGLKKDELIVVSGLQRIHPNDAVTPQLVAMDASARPAGVALASTESPSHPTAESSP